MVDEKKVAKGKVSRAQGNAFEARVRDDLEEKGWIVSKWQNNVEFRNCEVMKVNGEKAMDIKKRELVKAKNKWAGPGRPMMMGAGFPDFMAFRRDPEYPNINVNYEVIGVESKLTGELDREEKEKCKWLLYNNIFSKILIAEKTKVKNKIVVVYEDFKEKYWRFYK